MALADLKAVRATAGARWQAAVAELRAAYIDLSAHDIAASSGNHLGRKSGPVAARTFASDVLAVPKHAEFAADIGATRDAVAARRDELLDQHLD